MESKQMVHMVNQIALFFASYPKEEAISSVADHLKKNWEPRMRRQIIQYVAQGGGGLHELAVEAVKSLEPPPGSASAGAGINGTHEIRQQ